jgi:hypothetical protein
MNLDDIQSQCKTYFTNKISVWMIIKSTERFNAYLFYHYMKEVYPSFDVSNPIGIGIYPVLKYSYFVHESITPFLDTLYLSGFRVFNNSKHDIYRRAIRFGDQELYEKFIATYM